MVPFAYVSAELFQLLLFTPADFEADIVPWVNKMLDVE
jgi:hypothetical protein